MSFTTQVKEDLLHYYSVTDKQFLSAEPNRKLSFRFGNNENELIIILPKLKEFDYQNNYRDKNNMEYSIFYTYNKTYSKYIESFCYLGHILEKNDESEIKLIKNAKLNDKNEFLVNNIDYGRQIFINVLARNIKTSELILYKPIKGRLVTSTSTKVIALFIALFLVGIIVFISSTYYNEKNLEGYKLAGSSDMRSEDIRYTNINSGP